MRGPLETGGNQAGEQRKPPDQNTPDLGVRHRRARRVGSAQEQAQRMPRRIEHDPKIGPVLAARPAFPESQG
jgi:hypothetical protein